MPSKKRAYLQQFDIIHLPNPDLTYIRNSEREIKLYLCPSTSWKLKSGTLLCYLFLFSPSHLTRNHDANRAPRAYIYALEAGFSQVAKNCQVFCQTAGDALSTLQYLQSLCGYPTMTLSHYMATLSSPTWDLLCHVMVRGEGSIPIYKTPWFMILPCVHLLHTSLQNI